QRRSRAARTGGLRQLLRLWRGNRREAAACAPVRGPVQGLRGGPRERRAARAAARRPSRHGVPVPRHVRSGVPFGGSARGVARTSPPAVPPTISAVGTRAVRASIPRRACPVHNSGSPMSDQIENLSPEDVSIGDRPISIPSELPILPLRDTVLFPNSFMPLAVARESSVRLIDDAIANGKLIAVFTQRDAAVEEPAQSDLFPVGTATHIHKMFKLPDGSLRLIVQGLARLRLEEVVATQPYLRARVSAAVEGANDADRLEIDALARNIKTNFQQVVSLSPLLSDDLQTLATNITEPGR